MGVPADKVTEFLANRQQLPIGGRSEDEDVVEQFLAQRSGREDPVAAFLQARAQRGPPVEAEKEPGFLATLGEGLRTGVQLLDFNNQSLEAVAKRGAVGAGILGEGILEPVASVLNLPGAIFGFEGPGKHAADYLKRANEGIKSTTEEMANLAGMTDTEIAAAYGLGNVIGFTAPVMASVGMANLTLTRKLALKGAGETAEASVRHLLTGDLLTDSVAGAYFGGIFGGGESIGERVKDTLNEAAVFGVGRLFLNTLAAPFKSWRLKNTRFKKRGAEVEELISGTERTEEMLIREADAIPEMMAQLSEEEYIMHSAKAQTMLRQMQDERNLVQAITDVHGADGSRGVIGMAAASNVEAVAARDLAAKEFPGLTFDNPIKGPDGFQLHFGSKGLSNKAKQAIKETGFFPGQQLKHERGVLYEFVGKGSTPEKIRVRRMGMDKPVQIARSKVVGMRGGADPIDKTWDAAYPSYVAYEKEVSGAVFDLYPGLTEGDLIRAAQEGSLVAEDIMRRNLNYGGAVTYPESVGFLNSIPVETARKVEAATARMAELSAIPEPTPEILQEVALLQEGIEKALATTSAAIKQDIATAGTEFAFMVDNVPTYSFETVFDGWAATKGLSRESAEYAAARNTFAQRRRQEAWNLVDNDAKDLYLRVLQEQEALALNKETPLRTLAEANGMILADRPGTDVRTIVLKDINSGKFFFYEDEAVARTSLANMARPIAESVPNHVGFESSISKIGGGEATDGVFSFDGHIDPAVLVYEGPIAKHIEPMRGWFEKVENVTGIPLFSKMFEPQTKGLAIVNDQYVPWQMANRKVWAKLDRSEKTDVVRFWRTLEGEGALLPIEQQTTLAKEFGLRPKQVKAFHDARKLFDTLANEFDIPTRDYIPVYYSRIRPVIEAKGNFDLAVHYPEGVGLPEWEFAARHIRVGDLSMIETNPEVVMDRWIRSALTEKHVMPHWNRAKKIVDMRMKDLDPAKMTQLATEIGVDLSNPQALARFGERFVLKDPIRKYTKEYLNYVRGFTDDRFASLRKFGTWFFDKMGVNVEERVIDQYYNTVLSTMYGAAMAGRFPLVARNLTQNFWTLYPRLGSRHVNSAMKQSMTEQGFNELVESGAIRFTEAGVASADALFADMEASGVLQIDAKNAFGVVPAAIAKMGLKYFSSTQKLSRLGLVPYTTADQVNRGVAYFWQKETTREFLTAHRAGKIGFEEFTERGLPMYSKAVKGKFQDILEKFGDESALQFIGKMAADEANFIYGAASQPLWMQKPMGRAMGMFGTWPIWFLYNLRKQVANGTPRQIATAAARMGVMGGVLANLTTQTGVDFLRWSATNSLMSFTGGPFVDYGMDFFTIAEAPMDQKPSAVARLGKNMLGLSFPGQILLKDLARASEARTPAEMAMWTILGRPVKQDHWAVDMVFDPELNGSSIRWEDPANTASLENPGEARVPGGQSAIEMILGDPRENRLTLPRR